MPRLAIRPDAEGVATAAAERITALIEDAIRTRGSAVVCLTGGKTPERLYELLADGRRPWRTRVDWARVHLFWGDERHVPPGHEDSNFGMASRALVSQVPIPPGHIHRIRGELQDAGTAARDYESALRGGLAGAGRLDRVFDVMLLGLGTDAHIASIFPGSALLSGFSLEGGSGPSDARVVAIWADHLKAWRITLTPSAILDARTLLVVLSGAEKADAVETALELPLDIGRYPAQLLRAVDARAEWIMDAAAAARLRAVPPS